MKSTEVYGGRKAEVNATKGDVRLQGALFLVNSAPINCDVSGIALVVRDAARNDDAPILGSSHRRVCGIAIIPAWPNGRAPGC